MNQEFIIQADQGDEYRLRITSDHIGMLSDEIHLASIIGEGIQKDYGK